MSVTSMPASSAALMMASKARRNSADRRGAALVVGGLADADDSDFVLDGFQVQSDSRALVDRGLPALE